MAINIALQRITLVRDKTKRYDLERKLTSAKQLAHLIQQILHIEEETQEVFGAVYLSNSLDFIGIQTTARGTLSSCIASTRDIMKAALLYNAPHVVLFHNHPSGDTTPSKDDLQITKKMVKAGSLLEVNVLDHIILSTNMKFSSLKTNHLSW